MGTRQFLNSVVKAVLFFITFLFFLSLSSSFQQSSKGKSNGSSLYSEVASYPMSLPMLGKGISNMALAHASVVNSDFSQKNRSVLEEEINKKTASIVIPFIPNEGQWEKDVKFKASLFSGSFFVTEDGLVYSFGKAESKQKHGPGEWSIGPSFKERLDKDRSKQLTRVVAFKEAFLNEKGDLLKLNPEGKEEAVAKVSFFKGKEPSQWKSGLKAYQEVSVGNLYEGIQLVLRAKGKNVEKVFLIEPEADPQKIRIAVEGHKELSISPSGELVVVTEHGEIRLSKPVAYQEIGEQRKEVQVAYTRQGEKVYGFKVGKYDKAYPIVIDPSVVACTYYGGSGAAHAYSIAIDASGHVYIAGSTSSSFTSVEYDPSKIDAFIAKFDNNLTTLLASTFLGGGVMGKGNSIAIDSAGNVYVSGETYSQDFPTTPGAYDTSYNGSSDVFVSKFDNTLSKLLASTLGGSGGGHAFSIALDSSGNVYIAGGTSSPNFPTTPGAYDTSYNGSYDVFVSKFDSTLSNLLASTFLGGSYHDGWVSIAIDTSGNVYVTGSTSSPNFPTTPGAYDTSYNGSSDVFVSKFDNTLSKLLASTFLGGSNGDWAYSIALDSSGNVYIAGGTSSPNFPTTPGAYDTTYGSEVSLSQEAFIAKLSFVFPTVKVTMAGSGKGVVNAKGCTLVWSGNIGTCEANPTQVITLTAEPASGSVFSGWSSGTGSASACGGSGICTFKVNEDSTILAVFDTSDQKYKLTVTKTGNGTIKSADGKINCGTNCFYDYPINTWVTLEASVPLGWGLKKWSGDCAPSGKLLMDGNKTCIAEFAPASEQWAKVYGGIGEEYGALLPTKDGGYILAGSTDSFGAGGLDLLIIKLGSSGDIQWQKTYGGSSDDRLNFAQITNDGGYILVASTASFGSGYYDVWILKLDKSGEIQWQKTYGGNYYDYGYSVWQTSDGGYLVAAASNSFAGDTFGTGMPPYYGWVLKLDSNGNIAWQKIYGIGSDTRILHIRESSEGGYVGIGGASLPWGMLDIFVLKLDNNGEIEWQNTYGETKVDIGYFISQTNDGGYLVAGSTESFSALNRDVWLLKLDNVGNVTWQKRFGGPNGDWASRIKETSDGGFIVAGTTDYDYTVTNQIATQITGDVFMLKFDSNGNLEWQKKYGGVGPERLISLLQTPEGDYVIGAATGSGKSDILALKLDSNGNIPNCSLVSSAYFIPQNTYATANQVSFSYSSTNVSAVDTNAQVSVSNLTVNQLCFAGSTGYVLEVNKAGTGNCSITSEPLGINCGTTCSYDYPPGSTVNLQVSPGNNSVFVGWTGDCSNCDTSKTCSITVDLAKSCGVVVLGGLELGWNLVSPVGGGEKSITELLGKYQEDFTSAWKWTKDSNGNNTWGVYLPKQADKGAAYASAKGFVPIDSISPGEGFWVNVGSLGDEPIVIGMGDLKQLSNNLKIQGNGWHLIGLVGTKDRSISEMLSGKSEKIVSIWKWVRDEKTAGKWGVYLPGQPDGGKNYAQQKSFEFISTIKVGEGFWLNVKDLQAGEELTIE